MPPKEELQFPVDWTYRIICLAELEAEALEAIAAALQEHGCDKTPERGRNSSGGKYRTYQVTVTFSDLPSMRQLSSKLNAAPGVKFLL
ncbi:MAG: DUF493 family protein [Victivallales bacterium]|nr:DUF493 family protein [Victivallales bacterium]